MIEFLSYTILILFMLLAAVALLLLIVYLLAMVTVEVKDLWNEWKECR